MKVKDMRNLIKDLDDEVDIEVNSVWNEEKAVNMYETVFISKLCRR